jgi:hypothetical protein
VEYTNDPLRAAGIDRGVAACGYFCLAARRLGEGSVVHDDRQEGMIDLEAAVVFDETELLELVHEEVHA